MKKIPFQTAMDFIADYESGIFGAERLGQAFVNEFYYDSIPPDDALTDLFYTANFFAAKAIILTEYVEFDK